MSTVFGTAKARVASATQPAPASRSEPKLRVVYGAPFRPPRMPFVLFVVAVLGAGLVGLLLLNTELQRGTFQVTALNQQAGQLRDQQEQLERQVRTLESPQNLADRALRMGMVPNPNPVFLRLSDGKVLGVPEVGKAGAGTAMFGPGTPTGIKPSTPPTTKPPTTTKPPATKRPTGTTTAKPPTTTTAKPPTGTTTAKPPTGRTGKPPSTPGTLAPPATTGARTNTPTGG
jgi:hypothetical protein